MDIQLLEFYKKVIKNKLADQLKKHIYIQEKIENIFICNNGKYDTYGSNIG